MKCSFQYLALIGMLAAIDVTEPGRYNQVGDFHKFVGDDGPMPLQSVQFILVPREGDLGKIEWMDDKGEVLNILWLMSSIFQSHQIVPFKRNALRLTGIIYYTYRN